MPLDGEVVLPLADLEKIFGVTAAFSADNTSLRVDASEQALLESGESYYGARDVYWLSHIINAEAGNQPMDGQIAVGNVVLNRVADERFPNSVKEVVFDRRGGVAQFSPTADGRISLTPDEDAELAAKLAFEGYDPVGESLYFINPSACNASWFNSRLTYTATIGDHVFLRIIAAQAVFPPARRPVRAVDCRKPGGFSDKGLQSAARRICVPVAYKFHTCSLSSIFSHAHVARENDFTFLPPAGGKLCEAFFFDTLQPPARRPVRAARGCR